MEPVGMLLLDANYRPYLSYCFSRSTPAVLKRHCAGLWNKQPLNATGRLQFELGSGAAIWAGDVFDLKKKIRLSRGLDLQVFPVPPSPPPLYPHRQSVHTLQLSRESSAH